MTNGEIVSLAANIITELEAVRCVAWRDVEVRGVRVQGVDAALRAIVRELERCLRNEEEKT